MSPDASTAVMDRVAPQRSSAKVWGLVFAPVVLVALLLTFLVRTGQIDALRGTDVPPVEKLAITQVQLVPGSIELSVLNDGPDAVTIAQVVVDDAFWRFETNPGATLSHLQRTRVSIPYPWVVGETHLIKLLTSTGVTFEREIPVAV